MKPEPQAAQFPPWVIPYIAESVKRSIAGRHTAEQNLEDLTQSVIEALLAGATVPFARYRGADVPRPSDADLEPLREAIVAATNLASVRRSANRPTRTEAERTVALPAAELSATRPNSCHTVRRRRRPVDQAAALDGHHDPAPATQQGRADQQERLCRSIAALRALPHVRRVAFAWNLTQGVTNCDAVTAFLSDIEVTEEQVNAYATEREAMSAQQRNTESKSYTRWLQHMRGALAGLLLATGFFCAGAGSLKDHFGRPLASAPVLREHFG